MRPLHHYLRRFCSEQVQILLERMDNHFGEEFALDDTKWEIYTSRSSRAYDYYTKIEAYCVSKTCKEQYAVYKRQQMLNGILERTLSRSISRWEYEREQRAAMRGDEEAQFPKQEYTMSIGVQPSAALDPRFQQMDRQIAQQIAQQQAQHQAQHSQLQNQLRNWLTQ